MRIGRAITAGTMAMGAFRAYRQYKGRGAAAAQPSGRFRKNQPQQQRGGMLGSMLGRR